MLEDVGTRLMPSNIIQHVPTSFPTHLFIYPIDLYIDNICRIMLDNILALSENLSAIKSISNFNKVSFLL